MIQCQKKSNGNVYSYKISQTDAKTKSFRASALRAKNMAAVTIAALNDKRSFATNNNNAKSRMAYLNYVFFPHRNVQRTFQVHSEYPLIKETE